MYEVMRRYKRDNIKWKKATQNDNVVGVRYYFPERKQFGALAYTRQPRVCDGPEQRYPIQFTKEDSIIRIEKLLNKKNSQGSGDLVLREVLNTLLQRLGSVENPSLKKRKKVQNEVAGRMARMKKRFRF